MYNLGSKNEQKDSLKKKPWHLPHFQYKCWHFAIEWMSKMSILFWQILIWIKKGYAYYAYDWNTEYLELDKDQRQLLSSSYKNEEFVNEAVS